MDPVSDYNRSLDFQRFVTQDLFREKSPPIHIEVTKKFDIQPSGKSDKNKKEERKEEKKKRPFNFD